MIVSLASRYCQRCVMTIALALSLDGFCASLDYPNQRITVAMTQEPPNLNSMKTTDLVSYFLLGHINEGLLRYDKRGRLIPGVATTWDVTDTHMIFRLRDDAKWSDGSPVTAHDFVYAWRKVNDPVEAAPFAAIMYPIKNAEAIQRGELPPDRLGVQALSDLELKVELERPCGYCASLMPHGTFFPVNQAFHERKGTLFGSEAEHLLENGPFKMTEWVHESHIVLAKNEHYWDRESIVLNEIRIGYITSDNRTRLNLFRDDQIAFARLGAETVTDAVSGGMRLRTFLSGGVAYIWFNMREGRSTSNKDLRKAIQVGFNPDVFVNQVIAIPGYRPTTTLFPSWMKGLSTTFVEEYPPPAIKRGPEEVRRYLGRARAGLGHIPPLTILTVSSPTGAKIAEYFQGYLRQRLGLEAKVDQQSFKQYLSKSRNGDFDLVISSWFPDFDDLVTYADLLGSYNANNRGRFENETYDKWLRTLQVSTDPVKRFEAAARLQNILVEEAPVLPTAETGSAYLQHPRLKGVVRRVIGHDPDYTHARVLPEVARE